MELRNSNGANYERYLEVIMHFDKMANRFDLLNDIADAKRMLANHFVVSAEDLWNEVNKQSRQ